MNENRSNSCLIFVHGHGFKPGAEEFNRCSLAALRHRLELNHPKQSKLLDSANCEFVYFGDLANQILRAAGFDYDEVTDTKDRRVALENLNSLTRTKMFSLASYDRLPGKTALKEFAADLGSPLLQSLGLSRQTVNKLSPDLGEYWSENSSFRAAILERILTPVRKAMDRSSRILLIAHGAGSVYAYDALCCLGQDDQDARYRKAKIHTWLTLGSPLSDGMVQSLLARANPRSAPNYPSNIEYWHNLAAEDDYLCHDKTMRDDFSVMLKRHLVQQIKDHRIYNLAVRYGKSQPRSLLGYLANPHTAELVADWLKSS